MTTLSLNALVIVALASTANASCYYDQYNRRRCTNGLSTAARAGIAAAFAAGAILLLCLFTILRRRRIQKRNLAFIAHPTPAGAPQASFQGQPAQTAYGQPGAYPQQYGQYNAGYDPTNAGNQYPQAPQPAYNPAQAKPAGYDVESPPPPSYPNYAPPAGPPPGN